MILFAEVSQELEGALKQRNGLYATVDCNFFLLDEINEVLHLVLNEVHGWNVDIQRVHDRLLLLIYGLQALSTVQLDLFAIDPDVVVECPSEVTDDCKRLLEFWVFLVGSFDEIAEPKFTSVNHLREPVLDTSQ
jgi:hypothetical protein